MEIEITDTNVEKVARLRELLDQIDKAVVECRQIAGDDIRSEDWSWVRGIKDHLFGLSEPTLYRTIKQLEAA